MFTFLSLFFVTVHLSWAFSDQCFSDVNDHQVLKCRLRGLTTEESPTIHNNDLANQAKVLQIKCSDVFFTESHLKSGHFGRLPQLEQLIVEHCKTRHLPKNAFSGLQNLRQLSFRSHNDQVSVVMELHSHAFRHLQYLESLDLSDNNLWSLPDGLLCQMHQLHQVNFSSNHLTAVSQLGLSKCQSHLKVVQLSHNYISTLNKDDLLDSASSIEELNLSNNRLNILGEDALHDFTSLQKLDLSNNQLAALPPTLFDSESNVTIPISHLYLQNNSLTLLPGKVFSGLSKLVVLNLSSNAIASDLLSSDTFYGLETSLKQLDLSHNQLKKIESTLFERLSSLEVLYLQDNHLTSIAPDSFLRLNSLEKLILSNNQLDTLDANVFRGLKPNLKSLALDHNQLKGLPDNIFSDLSLQLEDLSLDNNQLAKVPKSISALTQLRTLDMGENNLSALRAGDFNELNQLYGLRLAGNQIQIIGTDLFSNSSSLHVLNLAKNRLSKIEQGSFNNLQQLKALRLDNNVLSDINGIVSALGQLQWLNVSSNQLQWFDYAFVPRSLQLLDISDNHIEELGNYYKLKSEFNLKNLDASRNKIKNLSKLSLPASLETIVLTGNNIEEVQPRLFQDKPNLDKVMLDRNQLSHLKLESLYIGKVDQKGRFFKKVGFLRILQLTIVFFI